MAHFAMKRWLSVLVMSMSMLFVHAELQRRARTDPFPSFSGLASPTTTTTTQASTRPAHALHPSFSPPAQDEDSNNHKSARLRNRVSANDEQGAAPMVTASSLSDHLFPTSADHSGAHDSQANSMHDTVARSPPYTMQDVDGIAVPPSPDLQEMLDSLFVPEELDDCTWTQQRFLGQADSRAAGEHALAIAGEEGGSVQENGRKYFRKAKKASSKGGKSSSRSEEVRHCANLSQEMKDDSGDEEEITPFYLKNLPANRVSETFEEYEKRFWELKSRGVPMSSKFFRAPQTLNKDERKQFYRLAQRFSVRMPEQKAKKRERNRKYKMRRFGGRAEKTEVQLLETRISSLRACLTRRLSLILAGHVGNRGRTKWTDQNSEMLTLLDAATPLAYNDTIYQMYEEMLRRHPQISRCIARREQQRVAGSEDK